jgi:hypothetical protein
MAVQVKRDGEVRKTYDSGNPAEDESAAFHWLLKHQGQSADWAIQYEGWSVTECPSSPEPRISVVYRGLERGRTTYALLLSEHPREKSGPYTGDGAREELRKLAKLDQRAADDLVSEATRNRMATVVLGRHSPAREAGDSVPATE